MYENAIKITGPMKTKITNDWLAEFPGYKKENPVSIAKRVGPLLISIWCMVKSKYVEPGCSQFNLSSVFTLSDGSQRMCANLTTIPKSRRYSLTWEQHEKGLYKEAVAELKELFPIPLEGPVTLTQVFEGYKKYVANDAYCDDRHYQDPALVAAWAGQLDKAQEYLDWGCEAYQEAKIYKPIPIDEWYRNMQARIANPEALRKTVEEQIEHHKLGKIPYQELIID